MPLVYWVKLFAWENQPSLTPLKNRVLADISSTVELTGPEILCNTFGSVVGTFSGGGDPNKDLYSWKIFGPNNFLLFSRGPGSFPKIDITFIQNGLHTIELEVSKGGISIGKFSKTVEIVGKPIILLENDYLICPGQSLEIEVIDPISSNFPLYEFEWKDEIGEIINTSNTLSITKEGNFSVQYFLTNSLGERVCQNEIKTEIKTISSFSIEGSSTDLCGNGSISFATNPLIPGEWFIQKKGEIQKESLGKGSSIKINPNDISTGFGEYELSFLLTDDNNPSCSLEEKINFSYIPVPSLVLESYTGASDCLVADGSLTLKAETDFDFIILEGTSISLGPFSKGDLVEIPNLFPGTYNIIGILGSCTRELGSVVPLVNTPPTLEFEL